MFLLKFNWKTFLFLSLLSGGAIILTGATATQSKEDRKAKKVLNQFLLVLNGVDEERKTLSGKKQLAIRKDCRDWLRENAKKYNREAPFFFRLLKFLEVATSRSIQSVSACEKLEKAIEVLENHRKTNDFENIMKDYYDKFGVSESTLDFLYNTAYCKDNEIIRGQPCEPEIISEEDDESETQLESPTAPISPIINPKISEPTIIYGPSGQKFIVRQDSAVYISSNSERYTAKNAIILLRNLLNKGLLNSEFLELSHLNVGDEKWVDLVGAPYGITFKHSETKAIIYFPGGQYIIESGSEERFWKAYNKSLTEFTRLVIEILDKFGGSNFEIVTQGSADSITFPPKKLVRGFDGIDFSRIPLIKQDKEKGLIQKDMEIEDGIYFNIHLPNLRGAFAKYALSRIDALKKHVDKFHVLEGKVTMRKNEKDRNCAFVVFIDWDSAIKHAESISVFGE